MAETRFNAKGVVGIMVWNLDKEGYPRVPCIRIYDPQDPETGGARRKPDGSPADFKDYELRTMIDPSIKFLDQFFEFVETDDGKYYVDFSLPTLGKKSPPEQITQQPSPGQG